MDLLTINDQPGAYPGSYYAASCQPLAKFDVAKGALSCDVCVIGGGYMGLSTALHLAKKGYDVILLDAQRIGFGASGRNGGQVGVGQRVEQDELEDLVGLDHARELWDIGAQAPDLVRKLCKSSHIKTDVVDGVIHANHRARYSKHSKTYAKKLQSEYGYDQITYLEREAMRELVGTDAYYSGTLDMGAGHVHPLEYAIGLARLALEAGARIFEQSKALNIKPGEPALVETDTAQINAQYVVLGCNGYIGDLQPKVSNHVMPINNYIIATEPLGAERQEQIIKHNYAVADSKFVVNYFRFSDDHRLLFGGTESYRYKFPKDIAGAVRKPMLEIFPQLQDVKIDYAWGGTLGITMNRMPHFERLTGNILSLSGFSGSGVAMATMAGKIASEAISGQAEKFDIMSKVPTPAFPGGRLLRSPLLVAAMLWYSLRDRL